MVTLNNNDNIQSSRDADSRQIFQLNPLRWSVLEGNSGRVDTVKRFED